ncbi:MAG: hypothetical protein IT531_17755 [Burkholderiales bacterium]|nr:hypothetical protein [Burkholderiales bacterium]
MSPERTVYGRTLRVTPVWIWGMQRASGLLLGPLVLAHVAIPGLAGNAVLNTLLLLVVLGHGYSGVRRMAAMPPRAAWYSACALGWGAIVALLGALVVMAGW